MKLTPKIPAGYTPSCNGRLARHQGLVTMNQLSELLRLPLEELANAPKAEWHHDISTGMHVWFYNPDRAYEFYIRRKRRKGRAK